MLNASANRIQVVVHTIYMQPKLLHDIDLLFPFNQLYYILNGSADTKCTINQKIVGIAGN